MAYQYLKAPPPDIKTLKRQHFFNLFLSRFKKLLPTIMITTGASLLISVGYPILSYEFNSSKTKRPRIISPVPESSISEAKGIISPTNPNNPQALANAPLAASTNLDYTKITNWFNFQKPQSILSPSNITHYSLSIPKLRIKDATVIIGGDDLDAGLIHYGGTSNPGEVGSPVIFGHSILPQFYNPQNYRAMFSLVPTLKPGDEIQINFDGITYQYIVFDYFEVAPEEVDVLEQRYNQKNLTLVTCVPPGTYWRRGIVKARLSEI